jgi:pimeloyl-ACP methyl ester carboxylesterase
MEDSKPTLVLFPGAWGNRTEELVCWWFRYFLSYFRSWDIVVLTYKGNTIDDIIGSVEHQLKQVQGPMVPICYSMGALIARGVSARMPERFSRVILFSGLERFGIRFKVLIRSLCVVFWPLMRTLIKRPLMFDTPKQYQAIFTTGPEKPEKRNRMLYVLKYKMLPEPAQVILSLSLPGLRKIQPPFTCPVLAIVPNNDFFFPDKRLYCDERVTTIRCPGAHDLICGRYRDIDFALYTIHRWLTTHS